MKSNFANVALVLSGLIAGATAFAQATPEQKMPAVQMAGETGGKMMHAKRDMSMDKHASGKGAVHGTMNPKIRVY